MIVFLRHGNTFAPGQKAVMIGRGEDLPLVASGRAQAVAAAQALQASGRRFARVIAAPLRRTTEFAAVIAESLGMELVPDARLSELDYGAWGGLSDEDIRARGDGDALDAWRLRGEWPAHMPLSFAQAIAPLQAFVASLDADATIVVSSQGVLRLLLTRDPQAFSAAVRDGHLPIKTGHAAIAEHVPAGLRFDAWDLNPAALLSRMERA